MNQEPNWLDNVSFQAEITVLDQHLCSLVDVMVKLKANQAVMHIKTETLLVIFNNIYLLRVKEHRDS